MGRLCYPTQASGHGPGTPPQAGPESCHGARRVWRTFCRPGTNFCEHYACRGTSLIGAIKLSRYRIFVAGTGPASGGAVQFVSKPENCQGAGFKLSADARVRVQQPLQISLGCRSKSKKCDKQLTHIVRVELNPASRSGLSTNLHF